MQNWKLPWGKTRAPLSCYLGCYRLVSKPIISWVHVAGSLQHSLRKRFQIMQLATISECGASIFQSTIVSNCSAQHPAPSIF
jgi:hypothetical protein